MSNNHPYGNSIIFLVPAMRTILFIASGLLILTLPAFRGKELSDVSMWWAFLCIPVNVITIVVMVILTRKEGIRFIDLVNHKRDTGKTAKEIMIVIPLMVLLGTAGLVGISWLVYGYMPLNNTQPLPVWAAITVLLLLPVTIVLAEIPLYLGYSIPRLKIITKSDSISIIYPLFFYALQHSFIPLLFDFRHILSRFLMFIPLLVMMALWYRKKGDLLPLMLGHGVLDIFTGIQILMVSLYPSIYNSMVTG